MKRRAFLHSALLCPGFSQATQVGPRVSFRQGPSSIEVLAGGRPFTSFVYDEKWDKPFLYPLRTASGIVLSRGFPVEKREGESEDHIWHRGIWYGHGDVNKQDFWREQGREKTGTIRLKPRPRPRLQGRRGIIQAGLRMLPPGGKPLASLDLMLAFEQAGTNFLIDATLDILADQGVPLTFGDTDDGGFAIRLSDQFRQDRGAVLLNSDGLRGTENIWGKRAKWVDYSTAVDGRKAGAAIFDHPSNFRHPTGWHARGYSLFSANPFAARSFTKDPKQDGAHTIPAAGKLRFRYRVIFHEGDATDANIEQLYRQFTLID